jgi:hypothetical protein
MLIKSTQYYREEQGGEMKSCFPGKKRNRHCGNYKTNLLIHRLNREIEPLID